MQDMLKLVRRLSTPAALVLVLAGAGGCGSTKEYAPNDDGGAIVTFAGHTITRATFAHWIPIEAILEHSLTPEQTPPPGEVPDPPHYTACIGYQNSLVGVGTPKPTPAQARQQCEARYQQIRTHILQILISYQWTEAEARAHGVKISAAELQQTWARNKLELFGGEAAFREFLKATGETTADEMKVVRFDMQALRLREKILHESGVAGLRRFYEQTPRELAAETNCSTGYVIAECKQYNGHTAPEL